MQFLLNTLYLMFSFSFITLLGCSHVSRKPTQIEAQSIQVRIELKHLSKEEWQVDYKVSKPVYGFIFFNDYTQFRHDTWIATDKNGEISLNGNKEVVSCNDPINKCSSFQFKFKTLLKPFVQDHEFFHAFEDGARLILIRKLRVLPVLCPWSSSITPNLKNDPRCIPEMENIEETFQITTNLKEKIYSNGMLSETGKLEDPGPRKYVYFGNQSLFQRSNQHKDTEKSDPGSEKRQITWVLDSKLPRWTHELILKKFPVVTSIFDSQIGKPQIPLSDIFVSYGQSKANLFSASGGNLRGQLQVSLQGQLWNRESLSARLKLIYILIHEAAHSWTNQVSPETNSQSSWINEGGTDAVALAGSYKAGVITLKEYQQMWSNALNVCLINFDGESTLNLDPGIEGNFHPLYTCGATLWLAFGQRAGKQKIEASDSASGIFSLWKDLSAKYKDQEVVKESPVIDDLLKLTKAEGIRPSLMNFLEGKANRKENLLQILKDSGLEVLPVSELRPETSQLDLGFQLLKYIFPKACGSEKIESPNEGLNLTPTTSCAYFTTPASVLKVEHAFLKAEGALAYRRAQKKCEQGKKIEIEFVNKKRLSIFCDRSPIQHQLYEIRNIR